MERIQEHQHQSSLLGLACPRCGWVANAGSGGAPTDAVAEGAAQEEERRELAENVALLEATIEQLKKEALTDPLTGLFNRRSLWEQLRHEVDAAELSQKSFSALFLDIDHFKKLNDTYGHLTGDLVLRQVAHLLRGHLRVGDTVAPLDADMAMLARFGGEEFVVVLPATAIEAAMVVGDRLRGLVRDMVFHSVDRRPLPPVTVSIGVAQYDFVVDCWDFEGVLDRADNALYEAKEAGRDCVRARRVA